jgi:hypothetical protein
MMKNIGLTAAEKFWYVLGCIAFGAAYFQKVPAKKALSDFGLVEMTSAESFWYVFMCIPFGAGYFAKIPVAKALSELGQFKVTAHTQLEGLVPPVTVLEAQSLEGLVPPVKELEAQS